MPEEIASQIGNVPVAALHIVLTADGNVQMHGEVPPQHKLVMLGAIEVAKAGILKGITHEQSPIAQAHLVPPAFNGFPRR